MRLLELAHATPCNKTSYDFSQLLPNLKYPLNGCLYNATMNRQSHRSTLRHRAALRNGALFAFIILLLWLTAPTDAYAEESIIAHFTNSIRRLYSSSQACQNALSPGPKEYIGLITGYASMLYPGGFGYWVLPDTKEHINDRPTCIATLQNQLMDYQRARTDFSENFPDQVVPPVMGAYNWGESRPATAPPSVSQSPSGGTQTLGLISVIP
jgi:hypothetical protein